MIDLKFNINNLWTIIFLVLIGLTILYTLIVCCCCRGKKRPILIDKNIETDMITIVEYDNNGYSHIHGNYIKYV